MSQRWDISSASFKLIEVNNVLDAVKAENYYVNQHIAYRGSTTTASISSSQSGWNSSVTPMAVLTGRLGWLR